MDFSKKLTGLLEEISEKSREQLIDEYEAEVSFYRSDQIRREYVKKYLWYFKKNNKWARYFYHFIFRKSIKDSFDDSKYTALYKEYEAVHQNCYDAIGELKDNIDAYQKLSFYDDKSYETLYRILKFRMTGNPLLLFNWGLSNDIYFDKNITRYFYPDWDSLIIDAGGYTGDTIDQYKKIFKGHGRIFSFEMNKSSYNTIIRKYGQDNTVKAYNCALGRETKDIYFAKNDEGSHFCDSGEKVRMVSLDSFVKEPISYIKLDVEGAELEVLEGARRHIAEDRPCMALSVYHRLEDIHMLYDFLNETGKDYKYILRKYSESSAGDLVLYAF